MLLTQHWFWYLGQQIEGINFTLQTLGRYYKRGIKPLAKFIQQQLIRAKETLERVIKPQKIKKREKHCEGSCDMYYRIHLNSKGFKSHKSWKSAKSYPSM